MIGMARALWLCSLLSAAALAAEPSPELMKRLADWADRTDPSAVATAVTLGTVSHERGTDGSLRHTDESVMRMTQGPDGRPISEVISARRDGKDATEEARKQAEARAKSQKASEKEGRGLRGAPTPFTSADQPKYVFELLPPFPDDPAMLHLGFRPRQPGKRLFAGDAKVDPEKGAAVWMQQRSSELPPFVDEFSMELDFRAPSAHGPLLSAMRMKGMGGLPLFKKRFDVEIRFSDYQLASAPPEGAAR